MAYTPPTIVDYGDVAQLTAAQSNLNIADFNIFNGQVLGVQNSTGPCPTGSPSSAPPCLPGPPVS